jgi:hypothetical protein
MADAPPRVSTFRLVLVPAILTLGVTLLRLYGERQGWDPKFFSREAGGKLALVGISWLPFLFGIYFAAKLARAGQGPRSTGRAIGFAIVGIAIAVGGIIGIVKAKLPFEQTSLAVNGVALLGGIIAAMGWPRLGVVDFVYGLLARIPVVVVAWFAMNGHWDTHYEKGPPDVPVPPMPQQWIYFALLPQMTLWIGFTLMAGGLVGAIVQPLFRRKN